MDLNSKHLAAGMVLAAALGAAPSLISNKLSSPQPATTPAALEEVTRRGAAHVAAGCAGAAQELRDFCATNPKMKDCKAMATWLDVRCKERAKRD